jgi:hypothetical protein
MALSQHPDLLAGYAVRPSWQVAGVDYAVGPTSTPLKDPATISMAGVSVDSSSRTISITGNNVTLDGYDFSLHGGYQIAIDGANTTISNSNFAIGTNQGNYLIYGGTSASNLTVTNNTFDGSALGNEYSFIRYSGSGAVTLEYNWFKNFPGHIVEFTQANGSPSFSVVDKYNLIEQGSLVPGYHLNFLQFGGGTATSVDVEYNTTYQTPQVSGGEGFQFYDNTQGGVIQNAVMAYNTMIARGGATGSAMSYMVHANSYNNDTSAPQGSVHDNFLDLQAAWGAFYSAPNGWSFSNNIDMRTGAVINSNNTESPITSPPVATPTISSFSPDSGIVGDHITDANKLTLTGTAAANSIVKVFDGATQIGLVKANRNGIWTYTSAALTDGEHKFSAMAAASGGTNHASSALSVKMDTVAPIALTIAMLTSAPALANTHTATLTGTAEANSTIAVFDGSIRVGTATADSSGAWTFTTPALSTGKHAFTAKATDAAGNTSMAPSVLVVHAWVYMSARPTIRSGKKTPK